MRIFHVEDNKSDKEIFKKALKGARIVTHYTDSQYTEEALSRLRADLPREEKSCFLHYILKALFCLVTLFLIFANTSVHAAEKEEKPLLTGEEKAWLAEHPEIIFGFSPEFPPFAIVDNKGGLKGYLPDLYKLLNERLGSNIQLKIGPWHDVVSQAESKKISGMAAIRTVGSWRDKFVFTTPLLAIYMYIFTRSDEPVNIRGMSDLAGWKVGYIEREAGAEELLRAHPEIQAIRFPSNKETIRALLEGRVNAIIGSSSMEYWREQNAQFGFRIAVQIAESKREIAIGVRNDQPLLTAMLNKGLAGISDEEWNKLNQRWFHPYHMPGQFYINLSGEEKAWLDNHPVIRVGDSSDFEPELIRNPDGTYSGTLVDFCRLIEERLGIQIEIIDDEWPKLLERAQKKEIDVVGLMNRGVAEKLGLTTIDPPYNVLVTAFARKDRSFDITKDKDIKGLRIAYFKEIVFLKNYLENLKGELEPVQADSPLDAFKILIDKKADVMIGFNEDSYLLQKNSIREIEPLYTFKTLASNTGTAVRADEPLLASILSKAFNSISREERDEILSKWTWVPEKKEISVDFSAEEKKWLAHHPVIKLGYDIDWPPIEWINEEGKYVGLAADFFSLIEKRLGITIEPAKPVDWTSMLALAKKGELDLLSAVTQTPQRDKFLDFTDPYLTFPMVIVTREEVTYIRNMNELKGKKIGVVYGYATQDYLVNNHPEIVIVPSQDIRQGLLNVVNGETFAFIGNLATISRIIAREGLSHIKISGETPYKFDLRIGTRKGEPVLTSIIQKALNSISEEERASIYNRWINVTYEYKFNYRLLWQVLAVVAIVLAAIIYWNRSLQRQIHLRTLSEKALADREALLRAIVDQSVDGITLADNKGKYEFVNPAFSQLTGFSEEELLTMGPLDLVQKDIRPHLFEQVLETKKSGVREIPLLRKNGSTFDAEITGVSVQLGGGDHVLGVIRDITIRKAAEEALKKSEASLAKAQKIAHIGNWEWNIRKNTLYWSDEIYRIFGLKLRQFTSTYEAFLGFVHPDDREMLEEAVQRALEGKTYSLDHRIVLRDGTEKTVHEEGEVEFDENGSPSRMMGTVHDITGRKIIEKALHKAKEEAEEATKLKDKFVSLVSHDLKSPIQRIMGYLELIDEKEPVTDRGKQMISGALEGCDEMTDLINEVLKLSRIRGGKIVPSSSFINIHGITDLAIKNYSPLAADKGIELINETPVTGRVYADEKLMIEVLRNLISNAVKFSGKGDKISLFIPRGEPATIAVADTGVGIEEARLKKLFLYEEQKSTRGTDGEKGTGFGLPLCHDIIAAHGGLLDIESEIDKGSTFYVRLPHVKPKVLIIEEDELTRNLFKTILEGLDLDIIEVDKCEPVMAMIENKPPQLFFIDLDISGMSGLQLVERIKKTPETERIPIIVVTASNTMEAVDHAFQMEADDFIVKPFEKERLLEIVNRFLG